MLLRLAVTVAAVLLPLGAQSRPNGPADDSASPRIAALRKAVDAGNRAAVEPFWAEVEKQHTPLIEPAPGDEKSSLITFVWKGKPDTRNVVIFGGVAGMDVSQSQMAHLGDTDVWYKTYKVRDDARFSYSLSPNDSLTPMDKLDPKDFVAALRRVSTFRVDPLNPKRAIGSLPSSYVEMPHAPPQPWIEPVADHPKGKVESKKFSSAILKNDRQNIVYTPPGFDPNGERYPLLLAFDGAAYTTVTPAPVILDNLIAKKRIPPLVAIFVGNPTATSRITELACSDPFTDFLAKEIVPWMRENYRATTDPAQTVVTGVSLGGLASVFAGMRHPEIFGNVLSQSASLWWSPDNDDEPEWLTRQFATSAKLPIRLFMEVGLMEEGPTPTGPSMVVTNRHLRDILTAKGYVFHYQEFNGGHEFLNWRGTFADGLLYLMGKP